MQLNQTTQSPSSLRTLTQTLPLNSDKESRGRVSFEKESSKSKKAPERFEISEKAIALLKKESQAFQSTSYDKPSGKGHLAISAYLGVNNMDKRESVQQILGVDLFA